MFVGFAHTHTLALSLYLSLALSLCPSLYLHLASWRDSLAGTEFMACIEACFKWFYRTRLIASCNQFAAARYVYATFAKLLPHTPTHTNTHGRIKRGIKRVAAQVADSFGLHRRRTRTRSRRRGKKEFIHILTNIYQ